MKTGIAIMEVSVRVQKLKLELPCDPAKPQIGMFKGL